MGAKREKIIYDITGLIFLLTFIVYIIFGLIKYLNLEGTGVWTKLKALGLIHLIFFIPGYIFSILIIIALLRWAKASSDKIVGTIGCLILPGILPFIYYFFSLREQIEDDRATDLDGILGRVVQNKSAKIKNPNLRGDDDAVEVIGG